MTTEATGAMSWVETLRAVVEIAKGINWPAVMFPLLVIWGMAYMVRLDRADGAWKIAQLFANPDGSANGASTGWMVALAVGVWVVYFETVAGRMTDITLGLFMGTFVAGGVWRHQTASRERIATLGHAPVKTEQTTTTSTTVTAAAEPAATWLAIEKAPQDGTVVLLLVGGNPDGVPGAYVDGAWRSESGDTVAPTHYMPRPRSPQ